MRHTATIGNQYASYGHDIRIIFFTEPADDDAR